MTSKEVYEALLAHLEIVTPESLAEDWESLKEYNVGVLVSTFFEPVETLSPIEVTKVSTHFDANTRLSDNVQMSLMYAA